jgi:hypothetical protein
VGFEWDDAKRRETFEPAARTFHEAATSFFDPLALLRLDVEHSRSEERFVLLGRSLRGRMLVTVFTERADNFRIISSRRATQREVRQYEEGI